MSKSAQDKHSVLLLSLIGQSLKFAEALVNGVLSSCLTRKQKVVAQFLGLPSFLTSGLGLADMKLRLAEVLQVCRRL